MSLPEIATRRRVTIGMVTLTFVLFGLIGLSDLKVNLLPDLSYPTLTVRTDYEGAAPAEIDVAASRARASRTIWRTRPGFRAT